MEHGNARTDLLPTLRMVQPPRDKSRFYPNLA
jgi:hypothetical protein